MTVPVSNHSAVQPLKEEKQIATKGWYRLGGEQEPKEREPRMLAKTGGLAAPGFWAHAHNEVHGKRSKQPEYLELAPFLIG